MRRREGGRGQERVECRKGVDMICAIRLSWGLSDDRTGQPVLRSVRSVVHYELLLLQLGSSPEHMQLLLLPPCNQYDMVT